MKKFKKDTWVFNGDTRVERVTFITAELEWEDYWNELKNAPALTLKVKTLDEVEPKVGMDVKNSITGALFTIVVVADNSVCLQLKDVRENEDKEVHELRVAIRSAYTYYEVSSEDNCHAKALNALSVEESLNERYVGLIGKWKTSGGWILTSRLEESQYDRTYLNIAGMTYHRDGRYHTNGRSGRDLVEFLGWEGVA